MCGNDISTVVVPNDTFLQQLRTQVAQGRVSVKNNPQGPKQQITMNEVSMMSRFDTSRLKDLQLIRCDINHDVLEELLKCDFTNLKILCLNHNRIGPIGCRVLASSQNLANLKTLELGDNKIKDGGAKALAASPFTELEDLNLSDNGLTNEGVKSLKIFSSVEYLSLSGNNLSDESVEPIRGINEKGFVYLAVSRNGLTNQGLRKLIPMRKLQVLLIDRNKITAAKSELQAPKQLFVFY